MKIKQYSAEELLDGMSPKSYEEALDRIHAELKELMVRKHRDYGPGNIEAFGEPGVVIRLSDKLERAKTLLGREQQALKRVAEILDADDDPTRLLQEIARVVRDAERPENEPLEDTYKDIANYGIILLMVSRGWWRLPLES